MDRQALHRRIETADNQELRLINQTLETLQRVDAGVSGISEASKGGTDSANTRPSHEPIGLGNIDDLMSYQAWGPLETDRGNQVREALTNAAKVILRCVPEGRYRDKAVNEILQARMDANAGISFRGRF